MLALACPALAQEVYPMIEFGVGHSLLHDNFDVIDSGFVTSATGNFNSWLGAENEFGGRFDLDTWSYVGGPRLTLRRVRTSSYFHVLLGGGRQAASISGIAAAPFEAAAQVGGGVNLWTTPDVGVNFGGDYRKVYGDFGANRNEVRFTIGVVFGAGTRPIEDFSPLVP